MSGSLGIMGNHIFICYSRKDWEFVSALAARLKQRGVPVWLDQLDMLPGENYHKAIDAAIANCAKLLLVLSPDAVASDEVEGEWMRARDKHKPIIPVLAHACEIPRLLRSLHWTDLTKGLDDTATLDLLARALGGTVDATGVEPPPPQPSPTPAPPPRTAPPTKAQVGKWPWVVGSVVLLAVFFAWRVPPKENVRPYVPLAPMQGAPKVDAPVPPAPPVEKNTQEAKEAATSASSVPAGMVPVPAGEFFRGCSPQDKECSDDEKPGRKVYLDAFAIDETEVTVAAYRKCVEAGKCSVEGLTKYDSCNWGKVDRAQHPINCVDWTQADTYCKAQGKRLPTEAEWEKAARGDKDQRIYPWGDEWDAAKANVGSGGTKPVGAYPAGKSPHGAYDMSGNVWEWVADSYDANYY